MIKVYRCVSEISFNLKINGNKRRINFESMSGGKSQYRTNETDVQEGIEGLEQFGNLIYVADEINEENDLVDVESDDSDKSFHAEVVERHVIDKNSQGKDIQDGITSFAEAKEYLITKGCDKTIRSKENILVYAQELGVEFPNLK